MANTFAPNGFSQYQGTGSAPTFEQTQLAIAAANTTPIFAGDPVVQATGITGIGTGYITQAPVTPQNLAITNFALSNGVVTATFTSTTAPQVGSTLVLTGLATASTLNGAWSILSASATTVTFVYSGATFTSQTATGYVFVPVAGIFTGCKYLSVAQKRPVWGNYFPGSDANGDVTAYVITDPNAQFSVMTGNSNVAVSPVGLAGVGQNIGFNWNQFGVTSANGNVANGLSSYFADAYSMIASGPAGAAANSFLPFRIVALQNYVPGAISPLQSINGNDWTTGYNRVVVGFNNSMPRQFAGI